MNTLTKVWDFIRNLFGFKRNSKYVKNYLNEANMRSGIYMGAIIIVLEIWLVVRQTNEYVIPGISAYSGFVDRFKFAYSYLSFYILFMICGMVLMLFSITYTRNKKRDSKVEFILNLVLGGISIFWFFMLFPLNDWKNLFPLDFSKSVRRANIIRYFTVMIFTMMPVLGGLIIGHTIYKHFNQRNNTTISILIIITFAFICLLFGMRVSYADFTVPATKLRSNGALDLYYYEKRKMITCFLTMIIFVACLLIWKPYISIIMLSTIFYVFMRMLKSYDGREFVEGDEINYITFLISLTMITISIYQQRITEAEKDQQLEHDAVYDHLVDINNVQFVSSSVREALSHNENYLDDKYFLFINIVNFRTINDLKGFEEGDKFLKELGEAVKKSFKGDLTARQSDDHYVILTTNDGLKEKIDELNQMVNNLSEGLFIHLKVGVYKAKAGESVSRAIDKARYACGIIKRKYDEVFLEYNDTMDEMFQKRQYIVNHLDEAIEKEWIVAYYQPVVWSESLELCGAEALARWIDPTYGFLSPGDFIPILEDTRLIHKLDRYIIEYVCKYMRKRIDEGGKVVPVSINFSRLDFELMDVVEVLEESVSKYNIDKSFIHVEVTESALSESFDLLNMNLNVLKGLGYSIWLDDFGSGYSSLNVLKDYDFDVLKIDMKFLTNFHENEKSKDILDCIVKLANKLDMKTLTEGVETKEQAMFLESIGCARLQGYLFGKPLQLADFEGVIEKEKFTLADTKI